jgi:hypothetical protein
VARNNDSSPGEWMQTRDAYIRQSEMLQVRQNSQDNVGGNLSPKAASNMNVSLIIQQQKILSGYALIIEGYEEISIMPGFTDRPDIKSIVVACRSCQTEVAKAIGRLRNEIIRTTIEEA